MKKIFFLIMLLTGCLALLSTPLQASEDFLGAPVIPNGKTISKTKARLELEVPMSHDRVLAFYRAAMKEFKDIKYRDWADATYIEDDGGLKWHSVTISKGEGTTTKVVIMKDNWTWIIGTLILRFVAVFVVLLALYIAMNISGGIISRAARKAEAKKAEATA